MADARSERQWSHTHSHEGGKKCFVRVPMPQSTHYQTSVSLCRITEFRIPCLSLSENYFKNKSIEISCPQSLLNCLDPIYIPTGLS